MASPPPTAPAACRLFVAIGLLHLLSFSGGVSSTTFTIINKCREVVWVGIQGSELLSNGGFELVPGKAASVEAPYGWHGRFWGRTHCRFDTSGRGTCGTGDCGGVLECRGAGGEPPATLAEFSLAAERDFYDVSLVDGYNLQMTVTPRKGTGNCGVAGCTSDLNEVCPSRLQMENDGEVVACKSACNAFNQPQYCCTGVYGSPQTCHSSSYSQIFKRACPKAYSYAYDDPTSLVTCTGAEYIISFCH